MLHLERRICSMALIGLLARCLVAGIQLRVALVCVYLKPFMLLAAIWLVVVFGSDVVGIHMSVQAAL